MDDDQNTFDSVQWTRDDEQAVASPSSLKANGKRRQSSSHPQSQAEDMDNAGIGADGYLECLVDNPQKENDGTKDAYVSYLVTTNSDFKTFARSDFTVRRRFTDFVYLYKFLFRNYPHVAIPPLPDKHNISYVRGDRFGSDFMQRRAHSLNRFIRRIAIHPVLRRNTTFLMFLETPDWNATMRGRGRETSMSDSSTGPASSSMVGMGGPTASSASAFESFQDWSMNLFSKPHKPDRRFLEVKEKAEKLEEDLSGVEKIVVRVARRESELERDYADLATQMRKLATLEPAVSPDLTSFASSLETSARGWKELREATDLNFLTSLHDMGAFVGSEKSLLKDREQKQLDYEALTAYLSKAATDRDALASQKGGTPSLTSAPSSFIRSKIEDVRGVDHESARRNRLRMKEMDIERLTKEVEASKRTSEAFDDQVVSETAEFERIKSAEFRDTLGGLCDAEMTFFKTIIDSMEEFLGSVEGGGGGAGASTLVPGASSSAAPDAGQTWNR